MKSSVRFGVLTASVVLLCHACSSSHDTPDAGSDSSIDAPRPDSGDASRDDASGDAATDAADATTDTASPPVDAGPPVPEPPPGRAVCGGMVCDVGEACCMTDATCFDPTDLSACMTPPRDEDPEACASNRDCDATEYCGVGDVVGLCGGVGTCAMRRAASDCGGSTPVCGCDGRTYADPCEATRAGVQTSALSPCGSRYGGLGPPVSARCPCPPGYTCDDATGDCYPTEHFIACGITEQCPDDMVCCGITGTCVDAGCPECCVVPPEGTLYPCRDDADCLPFNGPKEIAFGGDSRYYCDGPGCGPAGGCRRKDGGCSGVFEPVCGCDDVTYVNECSASREGVRVAAVGECPAP